jgi:hypothetical protein
MNWYAVRTLYRARPVGRPRFRDARYVPGLAAIEERIVLFQAKNGSTALRKGLREAARYAKAQRSTNVYGQRLATEVLDYGEAYAMTGDPDEGAEIFSRITIVSAADSASSIVRQQVGTPSGPDTAVMFIAADITTRLRDAGADI